MGQGYVDFQGYPKPDFLFDFAVILIDAFGVWKAPLLLNVDIYFPYNWGKVGLLTWRVRSLVDLQV